MNDIIKEAFINEIQKLSDYSGSYKCPYCGFDQHSSESDYSNICPKCGKAISTAQTAETHVNS
jgi:predicted RNA-binding Zn-ribbon protein involved in translation (DUF1610 family)